MDRTTASASRRAAAGDRLGLGLSAPARVPRGSYYAAAADHLALAASHLAAAARYLSTAFRVRRRASAPGESSSDGGDLDSELGLSSAPSSASSAPSAASSSPSILTASGSDAGTDGGRDDEDDIADRLYELLYVVIAGTPPYPLYKALPDDVVCAPAWTWFLILYGFAFAAVVTVVSARVFRSSCCTSTCLRGLLFAASVAAEVAAGINITPPTTLARCGTGASLVTLVAVYLLAWTSWGRSRLG